MSPADAILERSLRAYRLLRWFIRIATQVFFRRIEVVGADQVPRDGAVIFCGNHSNSLLDPILILAYAGRVVHFAAKDVLFENPILRPFLRIAGAVPVMRRMDHGGRKVDNAAMFETMYGVLAAGRATGIFPEGISHDGSMLAPLKSGAARMALGVKERHPDTRVYLVPTGLVYFAPSRFRSNVLIQFGAPIEVGGESVTELTDVIDARLRGLTINAEHWDRIRVLDTVRQLYQPADVSLSERARLARRFNLAYPQVEDRPDVRALYRRVESYLFLKDALGLDDRTLRRDVGPGYVAAGIVGHVLLMAVYLPLFLAGSPVHVPLGLLLKLAGRYGSPRPDTVATTKFLLGLASVVAVYAGVGIACGLRWGGAVGVMVAALLPWSGWATVKVLARVRAVRRGLKTGMRLLMLRREIEALRSERAALVGEVVTMVETYRQLADAAEAELEAPAAAPAESESP